MKLKTLLFILLCSFYTEAQQLTESNLPILIINTNSQIIVDEPKILVELKVIYNGKDKINKITDPATNYDGFAGIEFRGSSSQSFPKKPYGLELRTKDGLNNPQVLIDMPKGSDWILFASYNEKSLLHNVLTMSMGRKMGIYASRTRYVEVIIDKSYRGVYVLMEKIKRDNDRLNIASLKPDDVSGDQLTGGYVLKIDKGTGTNNGTFKSKYPNLNNNYSTYFFDIPSVMNTTQKKYITDYIGKFESSFFNGNYKDPVTGYRQYVDIQSFVKIFLLNEVSRNIDGYRISSYLHKDRDSKGGKLNAGPPWDFDISYGNADYCQGSRFDFFSYRFNQICPNDFWLVPFYWEKMVDDPYFVSELRNLYFKERKTGGIFDLTRLTAEIDSVATVLKDAQKRNFEKWPILGSYVWPNPQPIASSYAGEILELKNWLGSRLIWLDANMPKEFVLTETKLPVETLTVRAFPNPFIDKIYLDIVSKFNTNAIITISDVMGKQILEQQALLIDGENKIEVILPSFGATQAVHFLRVRTNNGDVQLTKMIKSQ